MSSDTSYPTVKTPDDWDNIDQVVDRVYKVMHLFNWTWWGLPRSPTKEEIKQTLVEHWVALNEPFDEENDWVSSGRIRLVRECVDRPNHKYDYIVDMEMGSVTKNYDSSPTSINETSQKEG